MGAVTGGKERRAKLVGMIVRFGLDFKGKRRFRVCKLEVQFSDLLGGCRAGYGVVICSLEEVIFGVQSWFQSIVFIF